MRLFKIRGGVHPKGRKEISAPVHAPTSGRIVGIGSYPAHHASGLNVRTISLQPDGEDRWADDIQGVSDPLGLDPEEIAAREEAGQQAPVEQADSNASKQTAEEAAA